MKRLAQFLAVAACASSSTITAKLALISRRASSVFASWKFRRFKSRMVGHVASITLKDCSDASSKKLRKSMIG
jgi:hypothetical protein